MVIDLRSDTVTQPTDSMRKAMAEAMVGDDVMGEDPTVNQLEAECAVLTGKEAALFLPSGTMGNLTAVLTHCQRGDEMIVGKQAHIFLFEAGGVAALGGVHPHPIDNHPDGTLPLDEVETAIRPTGNAHYPISKLITIENTHNRCNGAAIDVPYLDELSTIAKENGLKIHMDGARVFNASVYLKKSVKEIAAPVDSIMFCLSKGLSAPAGSLLCGSAEFIQQARRIRKQLGGGMRQSGILAAAGLIALKEVVPDLIKDMENAKALVSALTKISGLVVDPPQNVTNMVYIDLEKFPISAQEFAETLISEYEIKVMPVGKKRLRMVLHHWITENDVQIVVDSISKLLETL